MQMPDRGLAASNGQQDSHSGVSTWTMTLTTCCANPGFVSMHANRHHRSRGAATRSACAQCRNGHSQTGCDAAGAMPDAGHAADTQRVRDRYSRKRDDGKLQRVRRRYQILCCCAAFTQAGCAWNGEAMKYLQCSAYITRAEKAEHVWLDARAVWNCQYDLDGRMNGR